MKFTSLVFVFSFCAVFSGLALLWGKQPARRSNPARANAPHPA